MKYLFCLSFFCLVSCASFDKEKCQNSNWYEMGVTDGVNGNESRYDSLVSSCKDFQIVPDKDQYVKGRREGLESFCTRQNGYLIGEEGKNLPQVCPPYLQREFLRGYIAGKKMYEQKNIAEASLAIIAKKQEAAADEIRRKNLRREREIGNSEKRQCSFQYECVIKDRCELTKNACVKTGVFCNFDSECEIEGSCSKGVCQF